MLQARPDEPCVPRVRSRRVVLLVLARRCSAGYGTEREEVMTEEMRNTGRPEPQPDVGRSIWVDRAIDELASTLKTYAPTPEQLARIRALEGGF